MRRLLIAHVIVAGALQCAPNGTTNGDQPEDGGADRGESEGQTDGESDAGETTDHGSEMEGAGDSSDAGGDPDAWAHVLEVTVTGKPQAYTFSVKIHSSDTGCEHYCDWWEVLTVEGELLYRRTLLHAHLADGASGNPFERTGGPVPVGPEQEVIVRGHTNVGGYEGVDLRGSISGGFVEAPDLGPDFASALEDAEPQPPACDPNQT